VQGHASKKICVLLQPFLRRRGFYDQNDGGESCYRDRYFGKADKGFRLIKHRVTFLLMRLGDHR